VPYGQGAGGVTLLAPARKRPAPRGTVSSSRATQPTPDDRGTSPRIAVVGAGITGLVAARRLAADGARVTVFEEATRVGGQLADATVAGRHFDLGAESVFTAAPGPLELIDDLGLTEQLVPSADATTWIWTERGLRPLPEGFTPAGPSQLGPVLRSGALSLRGMLRAGLEPLIPGTPLDHDLAVGDYLERRFGREVTERLVDPLLGGLHAGDVHRLSLRAATPQLATLADQHRSLLLRRRPAPRTGPAFVTLSSGLGTLAERLADDLAGDRAGDRVGDRAGGAGGAGAELRLGARVTAIERPAGGSLRLSVADAAPWEGDGVVLATPARVAAGLVAASSPSSAEELAQLQAASVVVAALAYPAAAGTVPAIAEGTGILVPSSRRKLLKAATFLSTKWPHHADDEVFLIRVSAGRAGDDRALELDDAPLLAQLQRDLAEATGLRLAPIESTVRRWPATMPQLEVGHLQRLARISATLTRDLPGVALAGAPYHGPGLASCLRSAALAAGTLGSVFAGSPATRAGVPPS
jgi:protoporphyrinogen/coproporphyrinogen III oxidase